MGTGTVAASTRPAGPRPNEWPSLEFIDWMRRYAHRILWPDYTHLADLAVDLACERWLKEAKPSEKARIEPHLRFACLDVIRSDRRRIAREDRAFGRHLEYGNMEPPSPGPASLPIELQDMLERSSFTGPEIEYLVLIAIGGYTHAEIERKTGIPYHRHQLILRRAARLLETSVTC